VSRSARTATAASSWAWSRVTYRTGPRVSLGLRTRPVARRGHGVLAAGTMGLVVRRHGLCPVRPETSVLGVDIDDSLAAQSQGLLGRFLNFFLPTAAGLTDRDADQRRCLSRGTSGVGHNPSRDGLFGPHLPVVRPSFPPRSTPPPGVVGTSSALRRPSCRQRLAEAMRAHGEGDRTLLPGRREAHRGRTANSWNWAGRLGEPGSGTRRAGVLCTLS